MSGWAGPADTDHAPTGDEGDASAPAPAPLTAADALEEARHDVEEAERRVLLCSRALTDALTALRVAHSPAETLTRSGEAAALLHTDAARAASVALERLGDADEELATAQRRVERLRAEAEGPAPTAAQRDRAVVVALADLEDLRRAS